MYSNYKPKAYLYKLDLSLRPLCSIGCIKLEHHQRVNRSVQQDQGQVDGGLLQVRSRQVHVYSNVLVGISAPQITAYYLA